MVVCFTNQLTKKAPFILIRLDVFINIRIQGSLLHTRSGQVFLRICETISSFSFDDKVSHPFSLNFSMHVWLEVRAYLVDFRLTGFGHDYTSPNCIPYMIHFIDPLWVTCCSHTLGDYLAVDQTAFISHSHLVLI